MTLYQLTAEFSDLAARLTDEPDEFQIEQIEANEEAIRAKAEGYVAVWRTLEAEAETMKAEADRLADLAKKRRNGAQRLKDRLAYCLDACGIDRLPTPLGRLSVANAGRPSIRWMGDITEAPLEFTKVKSETVIDSDAALAAYKAGTLPAGFRASVTRYVRVS